MKLTPRAAAINRASDVFPIPAGPVIRQCGIGAFRCVDEITAVLIRHLRWSCPTTGGFQRWLLADAQGGTFVDMEMGIDPPAFRYGLFDKTVGRWFIKRWAEQAIDGLRRTLTSHPKA